MSVNVNDMTTVTNIMMQIFQFGELALTFLYIVRIMEKEDPQYWEIFWISAAKKYVQDLFKNKYMLEKVHSVFVLILSIPALLFALAAQVIINFCGMIVAAKDIFYNQK